MEPNRSNNVIGKVATLTLTLALLQPIGSAKAQLVVNDPPHQIQNILTQLRSMAKDAAEYKAQYTRWISTYQHYQQQLIKVQGYFSGFRMPIGATMSKVPEDWNVMNRCGGTGGISVSALMGSFSLNPEGNILQQQQEICSRIQIARNQKFNSTVEFMTKVKPMLDAEIRKLEARRQSGNTEGIVTNAISDAGSMDVRLQAEFQTWEAQMKAYDSYVASMEGASRTLAHVALKGKAGFAREILRTATLKTALGQ